MKLGIVGTNFISDDLVAACKKSGAAEPYAIYSRARETADTFAKKHGIERTYTDYSLMLSDKDIDAVYIASPNMCHFEHARAAVIAKKAVLCEKMITVCQSEFSELKDLVLAHGGILIEAMRPDFDRLISTVKSEIGRLGKIKSACFEFRQYSRRYDKFKEGVIMNAFDPAMKNSALADIGIYPLHVCISLFGEPRGITADGSFLHNGFLAEGRAVLHYDGFDADVVFSKITEGNNRSVIVGERGEMILNKISEPASLKISLGDRSELFKRGEHESNMANEVAEFARIVRENDTVRAMELLSLSEKTVRTADMIHRSLGIEF